MSTKQRTNTRKELLHSERLGYIVVAARIESSNDLQLVITGCKKEDRGVHPFGTPLSTEIQSAAVRKSNIQDDQGKRVRMRQFVCLLAVNRDLDFMMIALQQLCQTLLQISIIFDQQYSC